MSPRTHKTLLTSAVLLAASLCTALLVEALWRVYTLGTLIESVKSMAPASAEEVSRKVAPMLAQATNVDPIFRVVQAQHVELGQTHGLLLEFAYSEYRLNLTATFILVALFVVLAGISALVPKVSGKPSQ